jgi:hypothetical protein
MRARETNFYRTLQVDPAAEDIVIRAAYRALMKAHHPDRGGDPTYAQRLNAAYATLADPIARQAYDREQRGRRSQPESEVRSRRRRVASGARALVVELGEEVFRRFRPDFPEGFVRVFDFVGVLTTSPRHRLWLKRVWRGDAADAHAFAAAVEAARLSRPLWGWGSDLFVAVVPFTTTEFRWLLRGPLGPLPRLSYGIALYDIRATELFAVGRSSELPVFRPFATAIEPGRPSASAAGPPNT